MPIACAPRPGPRPPVREVCSEPPACAPWTDGLRGVTLHVWIVDALSPDCDASKGDTRVTVGLDGQAIGYVDVPCGQSPGRPLVVTGPEIEPGLHEIGVHANLPTGGFETSAMMSLPAFQISSEDKRAIVGAEVAAEVSAREIRIGAPLPYPPK